MKVKRQILLQGRVQGVGFRHYVKTIALQSQVNGWVRNLQDGRVEILFESDEDVLEEFTRQAIQGPAYSEVVDSIVQDFQSEELFEGFEVKPDGEQAWQK